MLKPSSFLQSVSDTFIWKIGHFFHETAISIWSTLLILSTVILETSDEDPGEMKKGSGTSL